MSEQQQISQKRAAYQISLERALEHLTDQFQEISQVEKVILFGSYAAGRRDLFTDLDLIVVMDTNLDYPSRTAWLYQRLNTDVDMDLLVYTPGEYQDLQGSSFLKNALKSSRVLYEKGSS